MLRKYFLTIIISLNLTACSTWQNPFTSEIMEVQIGENIADSLDQKAAMESEAFHNYLVGELAYGNQDFETAQESFAKTSALVEKPVPSVHEKLAELYLRSGKVDLALNESKKLLASNPQNPEFRAFHAGMLEATGDISQAVEIYKQLISDSKDKPELYILLANAYVKNGDLSMAEGILDQASKQNSDSYLVWYNYGRVSEALNKKDQALLKFKRAFEIDSRNNLAVNDIFRLLLASNAIQETEKFARQVLNAQPENGLARKILSQVLLGSSKIPEALEQVAELENQNQAIGTRMRLKIALAYFNQQNYKEAVSQLLLVLAEEPDNGEARFYLASIYASSGKVTNALEEIAKVNKPEAYYIKARVFEAFLHKQENNLELAEASIRKAYSADPKNLKTIFYLITILKDANKLEDAREYLEEAIELKPGQEKLVFQYAVLLHDLGEEEDSLLQMEEVLKINPKNSDALNFLAYSLAEKGKDLDRALNMVKTALTIKVEDPYYLDTLGWIYFKRNEYTLAKENLEKAYKLASNDSVITEHLGDIYNVLGEKLKALEQYRSALGIISKASKLDSEMEQQRKDLLLKIEKIEASEP